MDAWRQWPRRENKTCLTKTDKNQLDFDRSSHGGRLNSLACGTLRRSRLPWSTEEQDVAVRVAYLEATETIVGILERYAECCTIIGKFDGKRIGVRCIDVGIPPHGGITLRVRLRRSVLIGFDEDLRSVTA